MAEVNQVAKKKKKVPLLTASHEFAERVRRVATHRKMTITEVLDKFAGPAISREYRKIAEEFHRELGGEGG